MCDSRVFPPPRGQPAHFTSLPSWRALRPSPPAGTMGAADMPANKRDERAQPIISSHLLLFLAGLLLGMAVTLLPLPPQLHTRDLIWLPPTQLTLNVIATEKGGAHVVTGKTVSCVQQSTLPSKHHTTAAQSIVDAAADEATLLETTGTAAASRRHSDERCTAVASNNTNDNLEQLLRDAARFAPALMPTAVTIVDVNLGFLPMAERLWHHCQTELKPPVLNLIFVALDKAAADYMTANFTGALVYFNEAETFETTASGFGDEDHNVIVMHKWVMAQRVMCAGYDPLIMDVDIVFLRNPFNFLADLPACDLTATTEAMPPRILQDDERRWEWLNRGSRGYYNAFINTGFMLWRSSESSLSTLDAFLQAKRLPAGGDQAKFNTFVQRKFNNATDKLNLPFVKLKDECASWGGISLHVLSPMLFGSQKHFYEHKLPTMAAVCPYMIHYNWIAGFESKKERMIRDGVW